MISLKKSLIKYKKIKFCIAMIELYPAIVAFQKTLMFNKLAVPGVEAQTKENCKTASRSSTAELVEGQKTHHC